MEDENNETSPVVATMPAADVAETADINMNRLARYYAVLRDFMSYFHSRGDDIYPPGHEFTADELSVITPQDLIKWMTFKLYNKETSDEDEIPLHGSHFSIDFYKKAISYFMPHKDQRWDPIAKQGNPTRSKAVNAYINKIMEIDIKTGGSKKRKSLSSALADDTTMEDDSLSMTTGTPAKKKAGQPALLQVTKGGMHGILQRMHAQNITLMTSFNTISQAIENLRSTLQANNQAIMTEIEKLPKPDPNSNTSRIVDLYNISEGATTGATSASNFGWHYVHADGMKRRVPPSWQFPQGNIEEMYILWHCGDIQNRLAPMSLLTTADVAFLGKRAKINLSDLRYLINIVDEEATKKGRAPAATSITMSQALQSFHAGISALHSCAAATTPGGRHRNIMRMKWFTLMSHVKNGKRANEEEEEAEPWEVEETALQELVPHSPNDSPHDQWWYMHEDGIKRRVPSTYTFPMRSIEEMYVIWHCGMPDQKISPMRLFTTKDLSALKNRSKKNLSEVRTLMSRIDAEATRHGVPPTSTMGLDYTRQCCRAGLAGLNFQPTTQSGRSRDVGQMKWSSVARNKDSMQSHRDQKEKEEVDGEEGGEEKDEEEQELKQL